MSLKPFAFFWTCLLVLEKSMAFATMTDEAFWKQAQLSHLEGSVLLFQAGGESRSLPTHLYDLKFLGFLRPSAGTLPYVLLLGRPCQDCREEQKVYALRADGTNRTAFVQPGKILHPKTKALLFQSRGFYGKCLKRRAQDVYIAFQQEKIDRRRFLQSSVLIAAAGKQYLEEELITRRMPRIHQVLKQVKKKECFEVPQRHRWMQGPPIDITPKAFAETEEQDLSEEEKASNSDTPAE